MQAAKSKKSIIYNIFYEGNNKNKNNKKVRNGFVAKVF